MKLFRKISKLSAWLIFSKKYRSLYKDYMASLDLKDEVEQAHNNYEKVIAKIKDKANNHLPADTEVRS